MLFRSSLALRTNLVLLLVSASALVACGSDTGSPANGGSSAGGGGGGTVITGPDGGPLTPVGDGGPGPGSGGSGGGSTAEPPDAGPKLNQTMTCPKVNAGPVLQHIEAECALGTSCNGVVGSQSGTSTENGGTTVGFIDPSDWLSYGGIPLDGYTTLTLNYAKGNTGGSVQVRLDSPTGALIGSQDLASTGAWSTWAKTSITLTPTTGTHAIVLVTMSSTAQGVCNLDWIELSDGSSGTATAASAIHVNQLGYEAMGPKNAVVEGKVNHFDIVRRDGTSVWCGDLTPISFTEWGGTTYSTVDFSGMTLPGTYQVYAGGKLSSAFDVAQDQLFTKTFPAVLGYFKSSRADDADVLAADARIPFIDRTGTADVHGGWYDATGDISKYLTHLSYANFLNPQQIPLVAWSLAWVHDQGGAALRTSALTASVQQEALWGADYLLRVLDPAGFFYTNVFDGWSGDMGARKICAFSGETGAESANYQAAFREGGGMSIAALARIGGWGVAGSFAATDYIAGAEKAFAHLQANNSKYTDDGVDNAIDDYAALLAASELYAVTKKADYLTAASTRAKSLDGRLSAAGYFIADNGSRPFWHASDAGLPVVALARYVEVETDATRRNAAIAAIKTHLDYLVKATSEVANPFGYARQHFISGGAPKSGFFIPHDNETGYWWQGENARLASLAAAALIGGRKLPVPAGSIAGVKSDYARFAGTQLDWILGSNPYDLCFLQGFGAKNPVGYCRPKPQNGALTGGIANGITGVGLDGTGIQWAPNGTDTCWENWRWTEQWLPHAAWYMVAITAMAQ